MRKVLLLPTFTREEARGKEIGLQLVCKVVHLVNGRNHIQTSRLASEAWLWATTLHVSLKHHPLVSSPSEGSAEVLVFLINGSEDVA